MSNEYERSPVAPQDLQPARHFAASYAGEHVAGTEFVIGALFVAWGVSTGDILGGLLLGNLLAVLTWGLVCAPIAVQTRLTLYAYLEKIAGPGTIKIYSVVNGILFCILAGTMITVSASAVRILFGIEAQVHWYPSSFGFVLVALLVGAVVVSIAVRGFRGVAQFAQVCAPWMVLMFFAGALAMLPGLLAATPGAEGQGAWDAFKLAADTYIWKGDKSDLNFWHVAAFAWICNFAMHGGLSDMTLLRYAKKSSYGFFSFFGMFIGHYLAWICAGIMGAGAALVLKSSITQLDAGEVAFQALGFVGIVAVIIAGWTTSNPTIYRAGLAFQSLNPKWSRTRVTIIAGTVTTVIACFPFVFTRLLDFVGLMGLILAPIGAVIVCEHWFFPRLGLTRYWSQYAGKNMNYAAIIAWVLSLAIAWGLNQAGLHLFFLMPPTWIVATVIYVVIASMTGAKEAYPEKVEAENLATLARQQTELEWLTQANQQEESKKASGKQTLCGVLALVSLAACLVLAFIAATGMALSSFKLGLILPTLSYFIFATLWALEKEKA